jgi:hypothetical protein
MLLDAIIVGILLKVSTLPASFFSHWQITILRLLSREDLFRNGLRELKKL